MRKGADGIWTATVGPLDPEMYVYYFTVDSVRLTDPSNAEVKIGYVTSTTTSLVTVPPQAPGYCRLFDGRRSGRPFRLTAPRDVQSGWHHECRNDRRA